MTACGLFDSEGLGKLDYQTKENMNRILSLAFAFAFVACSSKAQNNSTAIQANEQFEPVAVVELFTSEGCSSCPSAEAVLNRLVANTAEDDRLIFPLAFHVDYWNRLGWTDRFSSAEYSERQRQYAGKISGGRVYTPQIVVNGASEFVGSNQRTLDSELKKALTSPATVQLKASGKVSNEKGLIAVNYEASGELQRAVLRVALVEGGLETEVKRGENGGRKLAHQNVVRVFESVSLAGKSSGELHLKVPEDAANANLEVVLYVQDADSWKVLGATRWKIEA